MNFRNTLAVVTSVASGIGRAIADSFSRTDRRGVRGLPGGPRARIRTGISRTSWIRSRVDRGARRALRLMPQLDIAEPVSAGDTISPCSIRESI
jgi:NAD(P)-dependent dehydrogenase (short-subunit alcohol dehydrogenase family)